jgi:arsenate reductase
VVTLALWRIGRFDRAFVLPYLTAQFSGAVIGTVVATVSFGSPVMAISAEARFGAGTFVSEFVVTTMLIALITVLVRTDRGEAIPIAVGFWISAAVFGSASTGFANPAVTVARVITDTYTGIAPQSVPGFLAAQIAGLFAALGLVKILEPQREEIR